MPTIDERAEEWVKEYVGEFGVEFTALDMVSAYLAGAGQAQSDYVAFIKAEKDAGR